MNSIIPATIRSTIVGIPRYIRFLNMLFLLAATHLALARAARLILGMRENELTFLARKHQVVVAQHHIAVPRSSCVNRSDVVMCNLWLQDNALSSPNLSRGQLRRAIRFE